MSWSIGYDTRWSRDIGYGVTAYCDEPNCNMVIDRGLSYVCCNQEPYGGENGCGLYFCEKHLPSACTHEGYSAKPDHPDWIRHKLTDSSWQEWREQNPEWVSVNNSSEELWQEIERLRGVLRQIAAEDSRLSWFGQRLLAREALAAGGAERWEKLK